ncbi:MAG TPA: 6-phospho-3-hexuloisomerase [Mycetocola sp.]|jgi:6-phospho-3-hexuloisomerase|uniref:6-phospho-3-hexuloisomerase n=1 Tax=Mycetocola sp. TaxID=1871042 RepID=UPI00260537FE|nr:6-phospho-3-hexuloisomerase [Mycetocola sp.]MCU1559705.1 6-phospho-3-hexuloisomerase [Mycetocola sp.]HEV7848003.1 6-phospho-3-hexuloisomerase [Mycetocola sp.]
MTAVNPDALTPSQPGVTASLSLIFGELGATAAEVTKQRADDLDNLAETLAKARRIFVLGAGRSGIALQMTAMRLMHLGLTVHVVGDVTTPAIGPGDVLLTASGSGTTTSIVRGADAAVKAGANVTVITTADASPLAALATAVVIVPAAGKLDRSGTVSAQYAGSLFEQTVMLLGDALFHSLWQRSGQSADELWPRHSNLE